MYQEERQLKILDYLNENINMSVHDICELLDVSRDTARRDILKLIEKGAAIRTHGGISLPVIRNTIEAYKERVLKYSTEKKDIANKALEFINEKEHYYFDVSTTVCYLAELIDKKITVVTHSLDNIQILSENHKVNICSTGGAFNKNNRFFYGDDAKTYIENRFFDVAFLGAGAIMQDGVYLIDEEDAVIKQTVIRRARKVIVLADSKKFNILSYYKGVSWDQIDVIITDKNPPAIFLDIIEDNNIQLIIT